jgi:Protein of unknown function (DUF1153)
MRGMTVADGNLQSSVESPVSGTVHRAEAHGLLPVASALPPATTKRWVIRRKAAVVSAVRAGVLTLEEACQRYHLSVEEFLSWQRLIDRHGMRGLRATRLQDYRLQRPLQTG